jgi:hypothetical protein
MKTRISGKEAARVAEDMAKPGPIRVPGHYTAEAIASRREIAKLLRDARALVKQVS